MEFDFITLVSIFTICEQCIIITCSLNEGNDRDISSRPSSSRRWIEKNLASRRNNGVMSDSSGEKGEKVRLNQSRSTRDETSNTLREAEHRSGEGVSRNMISREEEEPQKQWKWTNEQYDELLRLSFTIHENKKYKYKRNKWDTIHSLWTREFGDKSREELRAFSNKLRCAMRKAVKTQEGSNPSLIHCTYCGKLFQLRITSESFLYYDAAGITWTNNLNDDLMKMYYQTAGGEESKHGARILKEWCRKYQNYPKPSPEVLLARAETMLQSIKKRSVNALGNEKISENNARSRLEWKDEHDEFFQYLWGKYPEKMRGRLQNIYFDAVREFPTLQNLSMQQLYNRAKIVAKGMNDRGYIRNIPKEQDEYLQFLWHTIPKRQKGRSEIIHQYAVERFAELSKHTARQIYQRAKFRSEEPIAHHRVRVSNENPEWISMNNQHFSYSGGSRNSSMNQDTHGHSHSETRSNMDTGFDQSDSESDMSLNTLYIRNQDQDANLGTKRKSTDKDRN